jgi:hypothetical protein
MATRRAVVLVLAIIVGIGDRLVADAPRTPAEVELRRTEVAGRVNALEEEADALTASLAMIAERLDAAPSVEIGRLREEQERLLARQQGLQDALLDLRKEYLALSAIRTRSATGPLYAADPQGLGPLDLSGAGEQVTAGRAFNPAISVIPDINYYTDNRRGLGSALRRQADGFGMAGDEGRAPLDPDRGFNLREAEIAFMGAIDPYFDVWTTFVVNSTGIQTEEAYVQTRKFVPGLQLRFGRFLSGFGYINRQHPHQWDFFDQALPYELILGGGLAETGMQATYLPALPVYLLLGFEALQGENSSVARRLADDFPDVFEDKAGPRLLLGFLRMAPEVGYSHALQIGASFGYSRSHQEATAEAIMDGGLEGRAWLAGADVVWRFESGRAYGHGNATVQGEYLYRTMNLDPVGAQDVPLIGLQSHVSAQDGLYAQALYGFAPRWTIAGRFDAVGLVNRLDEGSARLNFNASTRVSANVTFNPTEFSRIRAQYSHGRLQGAGMTRPVHEAVVQFQMSLGAHGAHRF